MLTQDGDLDILMLYGSGQTTFSPLTWVPNRIGLVNVDPANGRDDVCLTQRTVACKTLQRALALETWTVVVKSPDVTLAAPLIVPPRESTQLLPLTGTSMAIDCSGIGSVLMGDVGRGKIKRVRSDEACVKLVSSVEHELYVQGATFSGLDGSPPRSALAISGCTARLDSCSFLNNNVFLTTRTGALGGGLRLENAATAIVFGTSVFDGNRGLFGGAIYLEGINTRLEASGTVTISDNQVLLFLPPNVVRK